MSLNVPFTPGKKPTLLVSAITRGQSLIFKQQLVPSARLRQGSLLRKKVCNRNLSTLSFTPNSPEVSYRLVSTNSVVPHLQTGSIRIPI